MYHTQTTETVVIHNSLNKRTVYIPLRVRVGTRKFYCSRFRMSRRPETITVFHGSRQHTWQTFRRVYGRPEDKEPGTQFL